MRAVSSPSNRVAVSSSMTAPLAAGAQLALAQLALEEPLALLQAGQLGGDHAQEVADLLLVEPTTAVPKAASDTAAGDDGSGRENEMATARA